LDKSVKRVLILALETKSGSVIRHVWMALIGRGESLKTKGAVVRQTVLGTFSKQAKCAIK